MRRKLYSALSALTHVVSPQQDKIGFWEKLTLNQMGAHGYRVASPDKDSQLLGQIQEIYNKEKMAATPKVIVYNQETPNAAFIHTGTIIISTGFLKMADVHEREVVLAHEITHQKQNGQNLFAAIAYEGSKYLAGIGAAIAYHRSGKNQGKDRSAIGILAVGAMAFSAMKYIAAIPFFAFKRAQEYAADAGAAWTTRKPEKLVSILHKLEDYVREHFTKTQAIPKTDGNRLISAVRLHSGAAGRPAEAGLEEMVNELYADHPPMQGRYMRLHKIEAEQKAAGQHFTQLGGRY